MTRSALGVCLALCFAVGAVDAQAPAPAASRTRVFMLGTGNPNADPDRFGPATVILVDTTAYLIDCGVGVVRRWAAAGRANPGVPKPWTLRRLFITHLHSDHTLGYADLIFSSWTLSGERGFPLRVFGPSGTRAMTDHLLAAYAEDIRIRTGVAGDSPGSAPPQVDVHEITPGVVYQDALVKVTAFAVHHGTVPQAFGFRFQTPDRDIVISGDAGPPSTIPEQCHGCDILIHEGGFFHRDGASEYRRTFHTSMEDIVAIAQASKPKLLVLYHLPPGDMKAGLQFIRNAYSGRVVAAQDLDVFR
jgi:ribonuclease BN (tRNA processing enzyme)